jgi:molecular chaperone GrpE
MFFKKRKMSKENEILSNEQSGNTEDVLSGASELPVEENTLQDEPTENPIDLIKEELAVANDKYLRLYSDFENYKKRQMKERSELIKTAGSDVIASLLPVLDDFERALKAMDSQTGSDSVKEGVQLIYQKLKSLLSQRGLETIDSLNQPFDTDLHEAITNMTVAEDKKGLVIDEIEKGYKLHDKVLRHAKVVVGN